MQSYRAPRWLPGGNLQTLWAATRSARWAPGDSAPHWLRERWATPDGDFIDVDHLLGPSPAGATSASTTEPSTEPTTESTSESISGPTAGPTTEPTPTPKTQRHLVLFHGLEGTSSSQYAQAFATLARQRGWAFSVPHFRGCSGQLNLGPRAYHSGDFEEIGWILQRLRARSSTPLLVVGISLGGNALLRWAQEAGEQAAATAASVAAVCSPIDLAASGQAIDRGFNWLVYSRMFLATMKPKALAKLQQHPGLFNRERLIAARNLFEFDDVFTAPLHGFRDTPDYWARASAKPHLARIRIPALLLNARNDPFVPASSLPQPSKVGSWVQLWQPAEGGHVGFPQGAYPSNVLAMPRAVTDWLQAHA